MACWIGVADGGCVPPRGPRFMAQPRPFPRGRGFFFVHARGTEMAIPASTSKDVGLFLSRPKVRGWHDRGQTFNFSGGLIT